MKKTQVQGVHHITIVGSTRQSALDFWEGVLGMPFMEEHLADAIELLLANPTK